MPYALYPIPHTPYPIPYTPYPIPYTLYPTPYTLYPLPHTLYPIPHTLYPISLHVRGSMPKGCMDQIDSYMHVLCINLPLIVSHLQFCSTSWQHIADSGLMSQYYVRSTHCGSTIGYVRISPCVAVFSSQSYVKMGRVWTFYNCAHTMPG